MSGEEDGSLLVDVDNGDRGREVNAARTGVRVL